jgi:hypothetical protein
MPTNSIGSSIAIATGLPSAFTEIGYEAMTWVVIGGLEALDELGDETALISTPLLLTGRVRQLKGATTGSTTSIVLAAEPTDAGQIALIAAAKDMTSAEYSFRVNEPGAASAPETYYSGVFTNYKIGKKSVSDIQRISANFTLNYAPVTGT